MSAPETAVSRSPLRWLLLGSLVLNLALGVVLGSMMLRATPAWEPGVPSPRALRQVMPEAAQPLLRSVLDEHRPALRGAMRERREARRSVRPLLAAEDFQRGRAEAALAELRQRDQAASAAAHAMLLDLLEQLSPAERRELAKALLQRHRHGHRSDDERRQRRAERDPAEAATTEAEAPATPAD
jgi:uncharacterized membrane protein